MEYEKSNIVISVAIKNLNPLVLFISKYNFNRINKKDHFKRYWLFLTLQNVFPEKNEKKKKKKKKKNYKMWHSENICYAKFKPYIFVSKIQKTKDKYYSPFKLRL